MMLLFLCIIYIKFLKAVLKRTIKDLLKKYDQFDRNRALFC